MNRYGRLVPPAGENLAWGSQNAKDAIVQLVVDDGVASRGHRLNVFREGFAEHGSYFMDSGHKLYGTSLCQNFCGSTYLLEYPDYDTFQQTFMSEETPFTTADGAPASFKSWSDEITIGLMRDRKLRKTVVRSYVLQDNTTRALTKQWFKDLPPQNQV